jgi:hypothetical protein
MRGVIARVSDYGFLRGTLDTRGWLGSPWAGPGNRRAPGSGTASPSSRSRFWVAFTTTTAWPRHAANGRGGQNSATTSPAHHRSPTTQAHAELEELHTVARATIETRTRG